MTTMTERKYKVGDGVVTQIDDDEYVGEVVDNAEPTAVDCWADTCGDRPCIHGPYYWVNLGREPEILAEHEMRSLRCEGCGGKQSLGDYSFCDDCMDAASKAF